MICFLYFLSSIAVALLLFLFIFEQDQKRRQSNYPNIYFSLLHLYQPFLNLSISFAHPQPLPLIPSFLSSSTLNPPTTLLWIVPNPNSSNFPINLTSSPVPSTPTLLSLSTLPLLHPHQLLPFSFPLLKTSPSLHPSPPPPPISEPLPFPPLSTHHLTHK